MREPNRIRVLKALADGLTRQHMFFSYQLPLGKVPSVYLHRGIGTDVRSRISDLRKKYHMSIDQDDVTHDIKGVRMLDSENNPVSISCYELLTDPEMIDFEEGKLKHLEDEAA